jgi:hypothetical protein
MTTATVVEYAQRRDISRQAVLKAIQSGRLSESVRKQGGKYVIDVEAADREWEANTDAFIGGKGGGMNKRIAEPAPKVRDIRAAAERLAKFQDAAEVPPLRESQAVKEAWRANLARLEYEEKARTLIPVAEVEAGIFEWLRRIRDAFLNCPARIADEVASAAGSVSPQERYEVLAILQREINQVLEQLTAEGEKLHDELTTGGPG